MVRVISSLHKLVGLIVCLSVCAAATWCRAAAAEAEQDGKITIELPLFQGGAGTEFFLQCAREYEKLRPNVRVDLYLDPRIADKVQVRVLEGSFFEATNAGTINYWPLIRNGDVLELSEFLDGPAWENDGTTWRDSFLPGSLEPYSENGKFYAFPLAHYASLIWYNKGMFREHGWKPPATWDELFALCEQMKKAGIAPLAFQGRYPYYAQPLYDHAYYQLGGPEMWQRRYRMEPGLLNNAVGVESVRLVQKFATYFQPGALGMSHTESQLQFFLGKTAMIPCGAWLKSEMMGKIPDGFELGCFNLPGVPNPKGEPTAVYVNVEPFLVMSKSKHPREAVDFLRFLTSRTMAGKFARMQDTPVAVRGANEGNLSKDLSDLVEIVGRAKVSYGRVPGDSDGELQQVYQDELYQMMLPGRRAEDIANELERKVAAVKNRADHPDQIIVRHRLAPAALMGLLGLGLVYFVWTVVRGIRAASTARAAAAPGAALPKLSVLNVLLFTAPALAVYSLFVIVPCIRALLWSLHQWNGLTAMSAMPFKGLLNFKRLLLESDAFWIALKNNLFLMVVIPLCVVPLALFLAASLSRGVWGGKTFRVVFFFPNLLGGVAATLLWLHLYNPQGGLVNSLIVAIGKGASIVGLSAAGAWLQSWNGFAWLSPDHLYWAVIPISVWGACGFNMVLYLAAMESIPESYYEAARIDGASQWRQFWTITLPLIWDILSVSLVFLIIGGMKAFETIWLLTNQRPQTDNHVVATRMVQTMFSEFNVGEATAIAVLLFLMVFVGTGATLRLMRRETVEM